MNFLSQLTIRHHQITLALVVVVSIIALAGTTQLRFDDTYRGLFRTQQADFTPDSHTSRLLASAEQQIGVLFSSDDVLCTEALGIISQSHTALSELEGVDSVVSIFSIRQRRRIGRYWLPLISGDLSELPAERRAETLAQLKTHPLVRDRLLSADATGTVMLVDLAPAVNRLSDVESIVREIRETLKKQTAGSSVRAMLTGLPVLRSDIASTVVHQHPRIGLLGVCMSIVFARLMLGSLRLVLIACVPAVLSAIWTFGLMGWMGVPVGVFSSVLPVLLIVIGLSDTMHLALHYRNDYRVCRRQQQATAFAITRSGKACVLTSLTTGIGFGSLMACGDDSIARFGLWAAIGVSMALLAVLAVFPILAMSPLGRIPISHRPVGSKDRRITATGPGWLLRHPVAITTASIALLVVLFAYVSQMRLDFRFTEHLPQSSDTLQATEIWERHLGGLPLANVVIDWQQQDSVKLAELLEVLDETHRAIEQSDPNASATSLLTLLDSLRADEHESLLRAARHLKTLPRDRVKRLLRTDAKLAVVAVSVADAGISALGKHEQLRTRLREIKRRHPEFRLKLTGYIPIAAVRSKEMLWGLMRSLSIASLVILVVISIGMRSMWLGVFSVVPNCLPLLIAMAWLKVLDQPLQFTSILALTVSLGIAVDDTIHFMSGFQVERHRGHCIATAVYRTFGSVVPAVAITTGLLLIGFATMQMASMVTVRNFASVASIAMVAAFLCDIVVLPALLACGSTMCKANDIGQSLFNDGRITDMDSVSGCEPKRLSIVKVSNFVDTRSEGD